MSGGFFDYKQYQIDQIAEDVEHELRKKYPFKNEYSPDNNYQYPPEVRRELENGLEILRIAAVYAQRIDWFLSGDDGEESFLKRLNEDLEELKNKKPYEQE